MSTDDSAENARPGAAPQGAGAVDPPDDGQLTAAPAPAIPAGPPWSVDLIADVHAGRYPAEVTGELRRRLAADPWAAQVLTALDATVDDLSLLPAPRMPERFALRLDAAIAAERRAAAAAAGPATVRPVEQGLPHPREAVNQALQPSFRRPLPPADDLRGQQRRSAPAGPLVPPRDGSTSGPRPSPTAPGPGLPGPHRPPLGQPAAGHPVGLPVESAGPIPLLPKGGPGDVVRSLDAARSRRRRWVGSLAAAAAVVAIGTAAVANLQRPAGSAATSAASTAPAIGAPAPANDNTAGNALELDPGRFRDALTRIEGHRPAGPLSNPTTYASCLTANSIDKANVTGVTSVTFEGKRAAAIAVRIDATHAKVVVVGPTCGVDGAAAQLAAESVTR